MPDWRSNRYVILFVLTLAYTMGYIDRQILNLLVQPIKATLGLSDLQISLLQGLGFSSGYVIFTPLFGRWADIASRKWILASAATVWSGFTALCGIAFGFPVLMAARLGLGSAEAAVTPTSWSILGDAFDDESLPRALSVFFFAPYAGGGLALLLGGALLELTSHASLSGIPWIGTAAPWQTVFILVALPGLVIAAFVALLRDPTRRTYRGRSLDLMPMREALRRMRHQWAFYGNFYFGMALLMVPMYALPAWLPAHVMRTFAIPLHEVGYQWGLITLVAGPSGIFMGPWVSRWLGRVGYKDAAIRLPVGAAFAVLLSCALLYVATGPRMALLAAGITVFCLCIPMASAASALQLFSHPGMRGMTASIYSLIVMVTGLGLAPTAVAFLTDRVFHDEARVGDSLAIICGGAALVGAILMARCAKVYRHAGSVSEDGTQSTPLWN
jgi:MFS transporter, Spinster family, sphingosine-1-phosphate transporter